MADEKKSAAKVKVVMTVNSHRIARNTEVEVDKKIAERLIENHQARKV